MAWVIFVLATLVMLGRFADFLIGPTGDRILKDRIVNLYVTTGTYEYSHLVTDSAHLYHSFLINVFGDLRHSLPRSIIAIGIYSGISSLIIWLLFLMRAFGTVSEGMSWTIGALPILLPLIAANYLIDMLSFSFAKSATKIAATKGIAAYVLILGVTPALIYIALVIGNFLLDVSFRIYYVIYTYVSWNLFIEHDLGFLGRAIPGDLLDSVIRPWDSNLHLRGLDNISFSILTILPLTTLYVFVGLVIVTFGFRRYVRASLMLVLDRAESSPAGVCTLFASGLAIIISVVTAFAGALK